MSLGYDEVAREHQKSSGHTRWVKRTKRTQEFPWGGGWVNEETDRQKIAVRSEEGEESANALSTLLILLLFPSHRGLAEVGQAGSSGSYNIDILDILGQHNDHDGGSVMHRPRPQSWRCDGRRVVSPVTQQHAAEVMGWDGRQHAHAIEGKSISGVAPAQAACRDAVATRGGTKQRAE